MTSAAPAKRRAQALTSGSTVADRYVVTKVIGQGGMGQVLEVEHLALGRKFALKVLRLERWNDELVRRFNREARALGSLTTPRVAQVTDFGIDSQCGPFYVMELLEGETLEDRLERDEKIPAAEALNICAELCDALADVHVAGIVHRDLKPSNVGLPASGPVVVKLLDFGLAASMDDAFLSRITQSQQILGSLPYMAPEQFNGAEPAISMDLYAVGVVLFECLTGRLPFLAPSTAAMIHQILSTPVPPLPGDIGSVPLVEPLLQRLLAKEASQRFSNAAAAAQAIRDVLAKQGAAAPITRMGINKASMPATMQAEASDRHSLGHMATMMVAESGMRLSNNPAPRMSDAPDTAPDGTPVPTHASHPGMLPGGTAPMVPPDVPPTPAAGTVASSHAPYPSAVMGYAPPVASYPGFQPGQELMGAQPPPASTGWAVRLMLAAMVGVVFAGLTAVIVALGLSLLDDDVERPATRARRSVAQPQVTAPAPPPPMEPHVEVPAEPPAGQDLPPPEPPVEVPPPQEAGEVETPPHVRSGEPGGTGPRRRGRGRPSNNESTSPQPQVRRLAPGPDPYRPPPPQPRGDPSVIRTF